MKRLIPLFFSVIFCIACGSEKTPKGVLTEDQLVFILADLYVADGYTSTVVTDTMKKYAPVYYYSLFKKHHTDSAHISASLKYYALDPARMLEIYKKVESRIELVQKGEQRRKERKLKMDLKKTSV